MYYAAGLDHIEYDDNPHVVTETDDDKTDDDKTDILTDSRDVNLSSLSTHHIF